MIHEKGRLPYTDLSSDRCPQCSVSLLGAPIPASERAERGTTHHRRELAVETEDYDGLLDWASLHRQYGVAGLAGRRPMTDIARKRVAEHHRRIAEAPRLESHIRTTVEDRARRIEDVMASAGASRPKACRYASDRLCGERPHRRRGVGL